MRAAVVLCAIWLGGAVCADEAERPPANDAGTNAYDANPPIDGGTNSNDANPPINVEVNIDKSNSTNNDIVNTNNANPTHINVAPAPAWLSGDVAPERPRPFYRKPWFWIAVVGGATVIAAGVGLAIRYGVPNRAPIPSLGAVNAN